MRRIFIVSIIIAVLALQAAPLAFDAAAAPGVADIPAPTKSLVDGPASADPLLLPAVLNTSVERYIDFFTGRGRITYQQWLNKSVRYLPLIENLLEDQNLPPDLLYLAMIESGFDASAVSQANAAGPWQLMPETARYYGLTVNRWVDERRDFAKSTVAAARYIRDLHDRYASWPLVLAAYNAGAGTIDEAIRRTGSDDFWDLRQSPFLRKETKGFVPKFMAAALIARAPSAYGFHPSEAAALRYDEVVIRSSMDLRLAAYCAGSTYKKLKALNPEILGDITPPDSPRFVLRIPAGTKKRFLARSAAIRETARRMSREGKVSVSLHRPGAPDDDSSACSIFDKKVSLLAHRGPRKEDIFPALDNHPLMRLAGGMQEQASNVTFCVRRGQESVVQRDPWSSDLPGKGLPMRVTIQ